MEELNQPRGFTEHNKDGLDLEVFVVNDLIWGPVSVWLRKPLQ